MKWRSRSWFSFPSDFARDCLVVMACLCGGRCLDEGRILVGQRLRHTPAPALGQDLRRGIGEDLLVALLHSVEDGSCNSLWRGLRNFEATGHVSVCGSGQDGVDP